MRACMPSIIVSAVSVSRRPINGINGGGPASLSLVARGSGRCSGVAIAPQDARRGRSPAVSGEELD